jgi:hypothetical protein
MVPVSDRLFEAPPTLTRYAPGFTSDFSGLKQGKYCGGKTFGEKIGLGFGAEDNARRGHELLSIPRPC